MAMNVHDKYIEFLERLYFNNKMYINHIDYVYKISYLMSHCNYVKACHNNCAYEDALKTCDASISKDVEFRLIEKISELLLEKIKILNSMSDEEGMKEVFRDIRSMCRINGNMTELAEIEQYLQHEYIGVFEKMH